MSRSTTQTSDAMTLIQHVWDTCLPGSWSRLNSAMAVAVRLAIEAKLHFALADFSRIEQAMRVHRWCGAAGGEIWYNLAIKSRHGSAIAAFEQWKSRRPFLVLPTSRDRTKLRLHIGARFTWHRELKSAEEVTVTSFAADQTHVIA
ncbi:hypothetical protein LCGC14_2328280, partial [marine sediment metagenome]